MMRLVKITFVLTFLISGSSVADIILPRVLSDGIVLQRDMEGIVWGWADHGESVEVFLNDKSLGKVIAKQGKWQLAYPAMPAGGPHKLSFTGRNKLEVHDVYFGDVWVASGQSNMQMPMSRVEEMFPKEVATANYPLLRQFTVPRKMEFKQPRDDLTGGDWQKSTTDNIAQHSATAFFFGRKLLQEQGVPIGILNVNMGGTGAECWISEQALQAYPKQYQKAKSYQNDDYLQSLKDADQRDSDNWFAALNNADKGLNSSVNWFDPDLDDSDWQILSIPGHWHEQGIEPMVGSVWFRREVYLEDNVESMSGFLRLGTIVDADDTYVNGVKVGSTGYQYPPRRYHLAKGVLKPGKNQITIRVRVDKKQGQFVPEMPYYLAIGEQQIDLTGQWQYKIGAMLAHSPKPRRFTPWNEPLGCYNAMLHPLFKLKIKGVIWYQGESNTGRPKEYENLFPELIGLWREKWQQGNFPFLFVQLANYMKVDSQPVESQWAELRHAQLKSLSVPNTAMAVITDVGNWNDLHPMDKKSVGERLALSAQALAYGENIVYSGPLIKSAKRIGQNIVLSFDYVGSGLMSRQGDLAGFAVAGTDGKFEWANAKINQDKVMIWHPKISDIKRVRYAWANSPDWANLINKEGLPASPFEIELK